MSKTKSPTLEEWKRLYDLMAQVKKAAPWDWMEEGDIFGIQMPETKELGFISVMGALGEHFAVAVYQGAKDWAVFGICNQKVPNSHPKLSCKCRSYRHPLRIGI